MIVAGTRLRFVAKPAHYISHVFSIGEDYIVSEVALTEDTHAGCLKFRNINSDWITSRFFTVPKE